MLFHAAFERFELLGFMRFCLVSFGGTVYLSGTCALEPFKHPSQPHKGHASKIPSDVALSQAQTLHLRYLHLSRSFCASGHRPALDSGHALLHQEERNATHTRLACAAGHSEEVCKNAVGDPLLLTVEDVDIALRLINANQISSVAVLRDLNLHGSAYHVF